MNSKLLYVVIVTATLISCKKDCPIEKTQEEILTAKTWKTDEARIQLSNGTYQYYKRGAGGNTTNYDSDSLKFNTNNTGVYYYNGSQYTTSWNFTNSEKSKMTLVINYSSPLTLTLENIALEDNYFGYSQYVSSGVSYLASVRRIPN